MTFKTSEDSVKKANALLPHHVVQVAEYLLAQNDFEKFELYVMILVSIELCLRASEVLSLKVCLCWVSSDVSSFMGFSLKI